MQEDLGRRQKLIDDQQLVIKSLREKIESLEEEYEKARIDLEVKLSEREADLKLKIATFEANLNEGRHYFEDVLREKQSEIDTLKRKLGDDDHLGGENHGREEERKPLVSASTSSLEKFESTTIDSLKSLYEHQLGLLRTRNEMLERTCANYAKGIKEMSANFGIQQHSDELASMATFKELMLDLQKTNVQLETDRIDLQVRAAKLKEECEQVRVEKEHLGKRVTSLAEANSKWQAEKQELIDAWRREVDTVRSELDRFVILFDNPNN
jgi:chromosome segregation ATPase